MKKNLLFVGIVLVAIAITFSSCFVDRGPGYGPDGYGPGRHPHRHYYQEW